jgi:hypothetical protein
MRLVISLVSAATVATLAHSAAIAEARLLDGTHTEGEIISACLKSGGEYTNYPEGSFGCKTKKGEVFCTKTGTLNQGSAGTCSACNPACGQSAKRPGGKTTARTVDSILNNAPDAKPQPLKPQRTTTSPGRAPTQPLTQQNVTRSPKTSSKISPVQPLSQQKTTGSATTDSDKTDSKQSMTSSSSSRRNGR